MRFMIIVNASNESEAGVMPGEDRMAEMGAYHDELQKAGVLLDASGLHPTASGWRIRWSGGKKTIVDGPFAEAKELVGGYTLIQVKSREEAMAWSLRLPNPGSEDGELEVRQLFEWGTDSSNESPVRYMIITKGSTESEAGVMPSEGRMAEMATCFEELQKAGVLLDAAGLYPSANGWRIRWSGGKKTIVDGPFAESKELVAGYTVIQVKSREEALEWTRRFPNPGAGDGEIEVRQMVDLEDLAPDDTIDRFRELEARAQN